MPYQAKRNAPKKPGKNLPRSKASFIAPGSADIPPVTLSRMIPAILVFAQTASGNATFTYKDLDTQLQLQYGTKITGTIPPGTPAPQSMFKYVKVHWIKAWGGIEKDTLDNFKLSLAARGNVAAPTPTTCDLASGTADRAHAMIYCDPELHWENTSATTSLFSVADASAVHVKASFWS